MPIYDVTMGVQGSMRARVTAENEDAAADQAAAAFHPEDVRDFRIDRSHAIVEEVAPE